MNRFKSIGLLLLLLAALFILSACNENAQPEIPDNDHVGHTELGDDASPSKDIAASPSKDNSSSHVSEQLYVYVPENAVRLNDNELDYFNSSFFVSGSDIYDEHSLPLRFLTSFYNIPEDIDMYELCYNGFSHDSTIISPEEASLLAEKGIDANLDVRKITAGEIDDILREYTGISLKDSKGKGLERFIYLPEYNAYYISTGDVNQAIKYTVTAGYRTDDGEYVLWYDLNENKSTDENQYAKVTLKKEDDRYIFVSNKKI